MKIIHRGTPEKDRVWTGNCHSCGSVAEATQSELTNITHDQRDGPFSWEKCPVCGAGNKSLGNHNGMIFYPKK